MSDEKKEQKGALAKVVDALMGKKEPNPMTQYVNPNMPPNYKMSDLEADRRKNAINTIGVRG